MKKLITVLCLAMFLCACGSDKVINGKNYQQYGLIDKDEVRDNNIKYEVNIGNVVWGVVLFETVVVPIALFGWYLYSPVGAK